MSRNASCPCGSGRRFKHCCGAAQATPAATRSLALAAHRAGALGRAESLYRRALAENPADVDVLHMLGVVHYERVRYRDALEILCEAAERTGWAVASIRHNVALALAQLLAPEANRRQEELLAAFLQRERTRAGATSDRSPLVSVVLHASGDAGGIARSIESVARQTYARIELVIVDDRPEAPAAGIAADALAELSFAVRVVHARSRGAAACLNQGASEARGEFVAFLDAGDRYTADRTAAMVDEVACRNARWGFSLVATEPCAAGRDDAPTHARAGESTPEQLFLGLHSNSFGLVQRNLAVASGNLFVERGLFIAVGGFRDHRHRHDWDFCLRAAALAEPVVVPRRLYVRRSDTSATSAASAADAKEEDDRVLRDFLAQALSGAASAANDLGPCAPANRTLLLRIVGRGERGALLPPDVLRSAARDWRTRARPRASSAADATADRTAVVVLGMHRSGTSALSRVLNLCGAFLPAAVKPPQAGVNAKGFWEPEVVLELDVRVMRQLGGDWDRVDFDVPDDGELAEEFVADAHALLASEYGGESMILLKDPRICVLAPLWHRALTSAGYRPVYVVPVRNPLEVALSLHARGDMSVDDGLALWLRYMRRVAEFADSHADVVHLRFSDLLDDWRSAVARIAQEAGIPLDVVRRAGDVDAFLEQGLKHQTASSGELDGGLSGPDGDAIAALYRELLARCDLAGTARTLAPAAGPAEARSGVSAVAGAAVRIESSVIGE